MDAGVKDEHGYIEVLAREDDVINVAGHRQGISPCSYFHKLEFNKCKKHVFPHVYKKHELLIKI